MPITTLTKALIATHERLYPRVAVAAEAGGAGGWAACRRWPVPEESAKLAGELRAGRRSSCSSKRRARHRPAADEPGPERSTMPRSPWRSGQALAGLEAFEGEHAMLSHKHQAICWLLPDGQRQPVARHLPATPPKHATAWAAEEHQFSEADHQARHAALHRARECHLPARLPRSPAGRQAAARPLDEFEIV